jgi:hypothetical protein
MVCLSTNRFGRRFAIARFLWKRGESPACAYAYAKGEKVPLISEGNAKMSRRRGGAATKRLHLTGFRSRI